MAKVPQGNAQKCTYEPPIPKGYLGGFTYKFTYSPPTTFSLLHFRTNHAAHDRGLLHGGCRCTEATAAVTVTAAGLDRKYEPIASIRSSILPPPPSPNVIGTGLGFADWSAPVMPHLYVQEDSVLGLPHLYQPDGFVPGLVLSRVWFCPGSGFVPGLILSRVWFCPGAAIPLAVPCAA